MADELRIKIVLDSGEVKEGFLAVEKQADKTAKSVGKSFDKKGDGINSLSDGLEAASGGLSSIARFAASALGPVGGLALGVAAASAATFKLALAGEQVNAVNAQFKNIATSAGLSADAFGNSIIKATQGLIDDEDALQIATKGIIALGDQASKLPAILDASRGVSRALGKDFKSTFEDLSTFVENGNARVLRQFGIILDLDKAYEKAAKSIGLTASALTEQQKQQIRANLILDEVPKKFGAAADSVTPLKDAFDRLKVSASNSLESISSGLANFVTKKFIDNLDLSNVGTTRLNNTLSENKTRLEDVNKEITNLVALDSRSISQASELNKLIRERAQLTQDSAKALVESSGRSDQELFASLEKSREPKVEAPKLIANEAQTALLRQEQLKRLNDLQAYVSAQDKLSIDSEIKRIETINNLDIKLTAQKSLNDQQSILLEQQKNTALSQIQDQFSATKGFSQDQRDQAALATKANFYLQEQALAQANAEKIKSIEDNKNFSIQSGFETFSSGFSLAATDFRNNVSKNFQEVGKQAFNTLGRGVGQAFAAFGEALASGEDAGKAFLQSLVGIFADIAIQLGTSYILQGIALSANPLTPGIGGPLIAAGAALATFGGLLKAFSGGKSKAGGGADTGGGIASSPSSSTELTQTENLQRAEAGTQVSVVIQGDVLDSDESGSRIVGLINSAFDKKGVVINQGVLA
jgi:hypothetical protein